MQGTLGTFIDNAPRGQPSTLTLLIITDCDHLSKCIDLAKGLTCIPKPKTSKRIFIYMGIDLKVHERSFIQNSHLGY